MNQPLLTPQDAGAAFKFLVVLGQSIRDAGPEGIASGILYSAVATKGYTLEFYNAAIDLLVEQGIVAKKGDILVCTELVN